MKTISDTELASYLLRVKQKLDAPDAQVDPLSQVVIAEGAGGKGLKRGRKNDAASASNKVQKLDDDAAVEGGEDEGVRVRVFPPPRKSGRSNRQRSSEPTKPDTPQGEVAGSEAVEGEKLKTETPPIWDETFDSLAFVSENLKGYSSRLHAMSLEELRKLAAGTGLKCLALNQMVYNRQEQEASEKLEQEVGAAKEELEKDLAVQLARSQADFTKSLGKEKKKNSALRKDRRNLTTARNATIVALVKVWKDATKRDEEMSALNAATERLNGDLKDLEAENDELKETMAGKFVDGFQAALEQVKVLFPEIDGDVLAQADFLMKVEDGKLVSRLPA
jgi:hypothetical protein